MSEKKKPLRKGSLKEAINVADVTEKVLLIYVL